MLNLEVLNDYLTVLGTWRYPTRIYSSVPPDWYVYLDNSKDRPSVKDMRRPMSLFGISNLFCTYIGDEKQHYWQLEVNECYGDGYNIIASWYNCIYLLFHCTVVSDFMATLISFSIWVETTGNRTQLFSFSKEKSVFHSDWLPTVINKRYRRTADVTVLACVFLPARTN